MEQSSNIFQKPSIRILFGFFGFIVLYFALNWLAALLGMLLTSELSALRPEFLTAPVWDTFQQTADLTICAVGMLGWLVFFAQFVLPVRTLTDRLKVVSRLMTYILGGHGPAIFIENGVLRAREGEQMKKGPGVLWLDSASAAVLCTDVEFTRTVGPGVHFTSSKESIAGTADLHQLTVQVGPLEKEDQGDRNPFRATKETCPDDFEAIQKRRWETSALTRDGIEIVATISVTFRIAAQEGEGNTRFGFNKDNVEKAIRDSLTRGANSAQPVWSVLPASMAVDVWREYVRKFRQDELFIISEHRAGTGLQTIAAMVAKRLKQQDVEQFDDFGRAVLKPEQACRAIFNEHRRQNRYRGVQVALENLIADDQFRYQDMYAFLIENGRTKDAEEYLERAHSREFDTISQMGLQVLGVNIKQVMFAPDIEERIISQWTTLWKKNAEKERDQTERNRKLAEIAGQEKALKEYAVSATRTFQHEPLPSKNKALRDLVRNTFLGVRRNPALLKRANAEWLELGRISSQLHDKRARQ